MIETPLQTCAKHASAKLWYCGLHGPLELSAKRYLRYYGPHRHLRPSAKLGFLVTEATKVLKWRLSGVDSGRRR